PLGPLCLGLGSLPPTLANPLIARIIRGAVANSLVEIGERIVVPECRLPLPNADEYVLDHVFGDVPRVDEPDSKVTQSAVMCADERVKGLVLLSGAVTGVQGSVLARSDGTHGKLKDMTLRRRRATSRNMVR